MNDILIDLNVDKEPYIKKLTNDKIINLTGQSGSGKSYYAKQTFNSDEYLIVDTDDIFSEKRFINSNGINKELGEMFRKKYNTLPNCADDFDLIYQEIINYCKKYNKILVIDCAQFHYIKDITQNLDKQDSLKHYSSRCKSLDVILISIHRLQLHEKLC